MQIHCRMWSFPFGLLPLLSLVGLLAPGASFTQQPPVDEYAAKASLVFNFLEFTKFPEEKDPLRLCILGPKRVFHAFQPLAERRVNGEKPELVHNPRDSTICSLVFVSRSHPIPLEGVLKKFLKTQTLTVGEEPNFTKAGGVIRFFESGDKIRFEINLAAARRESVVFRARLLELAQVVD